MSTMAKSNKVTISPAGPKDQVVPFSQSSADIIRDGERTQFQSGKTKRYQPGKVDIFFMGITIIMCGQYMSWNIGLTAGLYTYLICYVVMGLAYIAFSCCVAEVTSALPFAGGSYGLARCTLGFFPAFLIGCMEALEYLASVAVQAICVSDIILKAAPSLADYKPLLWLFVFYIPTTVIQCIGGAPFWFVSTALSVFQTGLLLVYCFGVLGEVNFNANAQADPTMFYTGGFEQAMHVFPFSAWFFLGVEALNLASDDVAKPKTQIPVAQVTCICVLVATGLFMFLTTVALPIDGGVLAIASQLAPLDNGFMRMFKIDPQFVTLLSLPAQYAGGYGFTWASSKLLYAMGSSRLLPPWLATKSSRFGTPHLAIITVSTLSYATCLIIHYEPSVGAILLPVCLLMAFTSYTGQCVGYISLKLNYPIVKLCQFKNPFGLVGAFFALSVWVFGIIAILGFQGHDGMELVTIAVLFVVLGVYYLLVARCRQIMSEEESKVLLVAHIMRFNGKKRGNRVRHSGSKPSKISGRGQKTRVTTAMASKDEKRISKSSTA